MASLGHRSTNLPHQSSRPCPTLPALANANKVSGFHFTARGYEECSTSGRGAGDVTRHIHIHCRRSNGRNCRASVKSRSSAVPPPPPPPLPSSAVAWSKGDLQRLSAEVEEQQDAAIGQYWRSMFEHNADQELFGFVERAEDEYIEKIAALGRIPRSQWAESGAYGKLMQFDPAHANDLIGMSTWQLAGGLDEVIHFLVTRIEGTWRELCDEDLALYTPNKWRDNYDICDSMDPERELEGWSYVDVRPPDEGEEGYPRLLLENRLYCSRVFRKMYLGVGMRQDGLNVLRMVLHPRYTYDLPILTLALHIGADGQTTRAFVDACPVRKDGVMLPHYVQTMRELQALYLGDHSTSRLPAPEWGDGVLSPYAVHMEFDSPENMAGFIQYAVALHRAHMLLAGLVEPVEPLDPRSKQRLKHRLDRHQRFCEAQLRGIESDGFIEAAYGKEWADAYTRAVMFDFDPEDNPRVRTLEGPIKALFDSYYEESAVDSALEAQVQTLQDEADWNKAKEILQELTQGQEVRRDKLESALEYLYRRDPDFRNQVEGLMPQVEEAEQRGQLGSRLASLLAEFGFTNQREVWTSEELVRGAREVEEAEDSQSQVWQERGELAQAADQEEVQRDVAEMEARPPGAPVVDQ